MTLVPDLAGLWSVATRRVAFCRTTSRRTATLPATTHQVALLPMASCHMVTCHMASRDLPTRHLAASHLTTWHLATLHLSTTCLKRTFISPVCSQEERPGTRGPKNRLYSQLLLPRKLEHRYPPSPMRSNCQYTWLTIKSGLKIFAKSVFFRPPECLCGSKISANSYFGPPEITL